MPHAEQSSDAAPAAAWNRQYVLQLVARGVVTLLGMVVAILALRAIGVGVPRWLLAGSTPFLREFVIKPAPSQGYPPGSLPVRLLMAAFEGVLLAILARVLLD